MKTTFAAKTFGCQTFAPGTLAGVLVVAGGGGGILFTGDGRYVPAPARLLERPRRKRDWEEWPQEKPEIDPAEQAEVERLAVLARTIAEEDELLLVGIL